MRGVASVVCSSALAVLFASPVYASAGHAFDIVQYWRSQGVELTVDVSYDNSASCVVGGTRYVDPYAITCSASRVSVNRNALSELTDKAQITVLAHEMGHTVVNTLGLQSMFISMGKREDVEVNELVADCLHRVRGSRSDECPCTRCTSRRTLTA